MANALEVRRQLAEAGFRNKRLGWSAVNQLPMLLEDGETIKRVASGTYADGYVVAVATDRRILFLDKKMMSFRVEDIHYEMVSDVEHYLGPFMGVLRIYCVNRSFEVKSMHHTHIQGFALYVEQRAYDTRQNLSNANTWTQMLDEANQPIRAKPTQQVPLAPQQLGRNNNRP